MSVSAPTVVSGYFGKFAESVGAFKVVTVFPNEENNVSISCVLPLYMS